MSGLREDLVSTLRDSAEREQALYGRLDDDAADPAGWTVKDHVAHLAAWRREACDLLEAVRRGETGHSIPDVDTRNAAIFEKHRDWPAERVRREADDSYGAFIRAVADCPEETLRANRPGSDAALWGWVLGNGHEHVADHLAMLAEQSGDQAAADAAQAWSHAAGLTIPGNAARADYNLACYYARGGRSEEALPPLRRALAEDAWLRELAKSDPDLEGMRALIIG